VQLIHKGYKGSAGYDEYDKLYVGNVLGIPEIVCYEGKNLIELSKNFKEAVDRYIEMKERSK
jgi:predicted HicB family RNase H-like nuclease